MATYTWRQAGGGDFNMPSDWTPGINPATTLPGPGDIANVNGKIASTISGNTDAFWVYLNKDQPSYFAPDLTFIRQIQVGGLGEDCKLTLASDARVTAAICNGTAPAQSSNYLFNIDDGAGATGTVIVQGPSALLDTRANGASVGINPTSTGSLQIFAGGEAKFATSGPSGQRRRIGQCCIRRKPQFFRTGNKLCAVGADAKGCVRGARQHLERSCRVDLIDALEQEGTDMQVGLMRNHGHPQVQDQRWAR
jgi:T5SS/PEP-CTERM-associated repeat protein